MILRKEFIKRTIIFSSLIIVFSVVFFLTGKICLIQNIFGIPCSACGMTRAYLALFQLDIKQAFFYHPLFWLVPIFCFWLIVKRFNAGIEKKLSIKISLKVVLAVIIIVYIIRLCLFFPHTEPMDFNDNSLVGRIMDFLKI